MRIHTIPLRPNRTFYKDKNWFEGAIEYRCVSKHQGGLTTFSVNFLSAEGECRREFGGPMVPGPYASGIALPTVISAHPMAQTPTIDVQVGDMFDIGGLMWRLIDDRPLHNPYFRLITAEELPELMAQLDADALTK